MSEPTKGDKTRAEIVDRAKVLFYQHGYDGTSFSDIVDATGFQRGHIYHYFKSKDDILRAVVERHLEEFARLTQNWDEAYPNPRQRLHAFVHMVTQRKGELIQYGCPIGSLNTELGKDRRDLQEAARQLFDLFRAWLARCFRELGYGKQSDASALHLLGRAQGIAVIAHVYQDSKLLQHETRLLDAWIDSSGAEDRRRS